MSTPQPGPNYEAQPGAEAPPAPYGQQVAPPPQQPMPTQPVQGPALVKPKRFGWLAMGGAAIVALILGVALSSAGNGSATTAPVVQPAPTVTVTVTQTPPPDTSTEDPSADSTEDTSSDETFSPHKSDFKIGLKMLSKECFGSAGCNVSFRIDPSYVGSQDLPTSGEIEVSYKITGLQDPLENTFTIDGEGTAHFDKEEDGQTESKSDKLGVKVTDVSYSE